MPIPWRTLIRLIPKAVALGILISGLFLVALVLAACGKPSLRDEMLTTFRRWHLLPPKTEEEKVTHAVNVVNWTYLTHGFGGPHLIWHIIWRNTGRKFVTSFFEAEMTKLTGSFSHDSTFRVAKKDDLGLIIGVTSLLDKYIGALIVVRFLVSISKRDYERIFSGYGPVASFSSKIAMGKALGVLFGDMAHDLGVLKKIRNDFAHALTPINLSDPEHSNLCKSLKMSLGLRPDVLAACGSDERKRVMESVMSQILYMTIILQRAIIERQVLQEHATEIGERTKSAMAAVRQNAPGGAVAT